MLKKIVSVIILVVFGIWVIRYVSHHYGDFRRLGQVELVHVVLFALVNIVLLFNNGYFLKECLAKFGVRLSLLEYFSISNFSTFLNYFVPLRGGAGFRALYLKKKHRLDFSTFASILAATVILHTFIISVLGLVCVAGVYIYLGLLDYISMAGFFILFVTLGYAISCPPQFRKTEHSWLNRIIKIVHHWDVLRTDKPLLARLALITINSFGFATVLSWIAFEAIGHSLNFFAVMYITTVSGLAALIGITPGALGILEASMLFIGHQLGVSSSDILMVALLNRSSVVIVSTALAPLTGYVLMGKEWRFIGKDEEDSR